MNFDIPPFHVPDNSPEAQAIELVMGREHVGPTEAVLSILRSAVAKRNPAQIMIGLFASDEDAALMDEVHNLVEESRKTQTTREIGL